MKNNNKKVYVIEINDQSVKIGISVNTDKRFKQIECASGKKIINYFISPETPNAKKIEQLAHKHFSIYRQRGEWFSGVTFTQIKNHVERYDFSNQLGIF